MQYLIQPMHKFVKEKLKKIWEAEFADWSRRPITKKYIYIWADGVNVEIRLGEDQKLCLLVMIGVTEDGEKELLAVEGGHRESKDSWLAVMRSLIGIHRWFPGMRNAPILS